MIKIRLHLPAIFDFENDCENAQSFMAKVRGILLLLFQTRIYDGPRIYLRRIEPALSCLERLVSPFQPPAEIPRDHPHSSLIARVMVVSGGSTRQFKGSAGSMRSGKEVYT